MTVLTDSRSEPDFDLFLLYGAYSGNFVQHSAEDISVWSLSGSAGSLGSATLTLNINAPYGQNGLTTPVQVLGELYFDAADTISFSYTINDPNFWNSFPYPQFTGGKITGGTGRYAGATGSLDLSTSTQSLKGSGSVTVGDDTIPLNLTNFNGAYCNGYNCRQRDYLNGTVSGSTSLGNVSGTLKIETTFTFLNTAAVAAGPMVLNFNNSDSITVLMDTSDAPTTFYIVGGTGTYLGASGSLSVSNIHSGYTGYEYRGNGIITTPPPGAPIITQVKTAFGSATIGKNDWVQINGIDLATPDTPASGVDWSNAPEFASGMMPTSLGAIDSVEFCNPDVTDSCPMGYVYYYCSSVTNSGCTAGDQINVLTPVSMKKNLKKVIVTRNGIASAPFLVRNEPPSPAFPLFDAQGHVVAAHLDYSLIGPATLFPGVSTPAKAGETVILVAFGLGIPSVGTLVDGSSTQTGTYSVRCWVSGFEANVVAVAISPGLAQLNLTLPSGLPSGENAIVCGDGLVPFFPGAIITVQ